MQTLPTKGDPVIWIGDDEPIKGFVLKVEPEYSQAQIQWATGTIGWHRVHANCGIKLEQ